MDNLMPDGYGQAVPSTKPVVTQADEPKITPEDCEAAAVFLGSWEPGPEMTIVKLSRAFAKHRLTHSPYCGGPNASKEPPMTNDSKPVVTGADPSPEAMALARMVQSLTASDGLTYAGHAIDEYLAEHRLTHSPSEPSVVSQDLVPVPPLVSEIPPQAPAFASFRGEPEFATSLADRGGTSANPQAWLYASGDGSMEVVLNRDCQRAGELISAGWTETPLFKGPSND